MQPRQELLAHLQAWCFDPPGSTWSFPQKLARDRWKHDPGLGPLGRDLEAMGLVVREWPRPMAGVPAALAGGPNGLPASV